MPKVERGIADILRLQVQAYVKRPRRATKFLCDYVCLRRFDRIKPYQLTGSCHHERLSPVLPNSFIASIITLYSLGLLRLIPPFYPRAIITITVEVATHIVSDDRLLSNGMKDSETKK